MADDRRPWKNALVGATMSAMVLSVGAVTISTAANASSQPMLATAWVNMRVGPSTSQSVITVLAPQQKVTATGKTSGSWREVVSGDKTGWVFGTYLASASPSGSPSSDSTTPSGSTTKPESAGSVTTTGNVNVRTGPGLDSAVITTLPKGTTLPTTGEKTAEWTQVIYQGKANWMYSQFLTAGTKKLPEVTGQLRTTANLYLRTGGSLDFAYTGVLPGNTIVDVTGQTTADYTEIVHGGETRWIATRYTTKLTATSPEKPEEPKATGSLWVNVGSLYLRETSASDGKIITTVPRGTELPTTGVKQGDRTQVIYQGIVRWAYTAYLSGSKPAPAPTKVTVTGYDRLNANSKSVVAAVIANFPNIKVIGGWRSSSAYSSDHPNGRATDIMVPDWKGSGVAYGTSIADYFQKNAGKHKVRYIIWRQKIWNVAYPARGWRAMENRGSATANHYDHVHVSVYD